MTIKDIRNKNWVTEGITLVSTIFNLWSELESGNV